MAKSRIVVTGATIGLPPGLRAPASKPLAGAKATRAQVPVGWVRLQADDRPELTVFCELGDNVPDPDDGYGGIVSVDRPGDKSLTRDGGHPAMTVPLELLLDARASGGTVNDLYDNLEALAGRGRKRRAGPRPKLIVDTAGLFRNDTSVFPDSRWWLSGLAWSKDEDDQETDDDGNRILAVATVTLTEATEAAALRTRAQRLAHQTKTSSAKKPPYRAVSGDTLMSIARKKLGDPGRWRELADLNSIRDPYNVHAGDLIKLP